MSCIQNILSSFASVKISTLASIVDPSISEHELEQRIARLIMDGQLPQFRIDGEYIVRDSPQVDVGDISIHILNNVVLSSLPES
jgi:hypothetical protein